MNKDRQVLFITATVWYPSPAKLLSATALVIARHYRLGWFSWSPVLEKHKLLSHEFSQNCLSTRCHGLSHVSAIS